MPINFITPEDLSRLTSRREGETKIGETIVAGSSVSIDELRTTSAPFVILGIPEDIGPRANCGVGGSHSAWEPFLSKFANIQENAFTKGSDYILLGNVDCSKWNNIDTNDLSTLRQAVAELDEVVSGTIEAIVSAGKIPIIIGGGHNNAYGALKGSAQALKRAVHCINLDPHADYRPAEGRHSGNGFSYARREGFLGEYAILGLHENYNSNNMLQQLKKDAIHYRLFEDIFVRGKVTFPNAMRQLLSTVNTDAYGVELDCDAIEGFPSSAQSPSGISANQARQYVSAAGSSANALYLHLPEAAPSLVTGSAGQVGKLLAYLVSDFARARKNYL